jgi:SAM-dependent methyltransferase
LVAAPGEYDGHDLEVLADLPRYSRMILDAFGGAVHGRVLEVGAGTGNFSAHWLPHAKEAVLVEPAGHLHDKLAQRFAHQTTVQTWHGIADTLPSAVTTGGFDCIILCNVLEHIEDDVNTVRHLASLLRPGGSLCLFVPAIPALYGSLDKLVHHLRRYTRTSLRAAVAPSGLHIVHLHYMDMLGVLPWLMVGRVLKKKRFGQEAGLYDRVGVPITRLVETHIKRRKWTVPVGKSLVLVARKAR